VAPIAGLNPYYRRHTWNAERHSARPGRSFANKGMANPSALLECMTADAVSRPTGHTYAVPSALHATAAPSGQLTTRTCNNVAATTTTTLYNLTPIVQRSPGRPRRWNLAYSTVRLRHTCSHYKPCTASLRFGWSTVQQHNPLPVLGGCIWGVACRALRPEMTRRMLLPHVTLTERCTRAVTIRNITTDCT
jgi:hypothetical protein